MSVIQSKHHLKAGIHTHKQVIRVRDITTNPEKFHQIMELPMDITAYLPNPPSAHAFQTVILGFPTVTGAVTVTTLPSSINSSLAL